MRAFRVVVPVLAGVAGVVALVVTAGRALPVAHRVARSVVIPAPPRAVFERVADTRNSPRWRSGLDSVEVLAVDDSGAPLRYREHSSDGALTYEVTERVAPRRLVTRIADEGLPFGGRWIFELEEASQGATRVRITEEGEVHDLFFRFVAHYVFGHTGTIERYLRDLSASFDSSAARHR